MKEVLMLKSIVSLYNLQSERPVTTKYWDGLIDTGDIFFLKNVQVNDITTFKFAIYLHNRQIAYLCYMQIAGEDYFKQMQDNSRAFIILLKLQDQPYRFYGVLFNDDNSAKAFADKYQETKRFMENARKQAPSVTQIKLQGKFTSKGSSQNRTEFLFDDLLKCMKRWSNKEMNKFLEYQNPLFIKNDIISLVENVNIVLSCEHNIEHIIVLHEFLNFTATYIKILLEFDKVSNQEIHVRDYSDYTNEHAFCNLYVIILRIIDLATKILRHQAEIFQRFLSVACVKSDFIKYINQTFETFEEYNWRRDVMENPRHFFTFVLLQRKAPAKVLNLVNQRTLGQDPDNLISIRLLESLAEFLFYLTSVKHPDETEYIPYEKFSKKVTERIMSINDKELKDVDRDSVVNLIRLCDCLNEKLPFKLRLPLHQNELLELWLFKSFLFSSTFEKRLKGINDLREICSDWNTSEELARYQIPRKVERERMVNWIIENKIVESVFKAASTPIEIIKRAKDILIFLCKSKSGELPYTYLDLLWKEMTETNYKDVSRVYQQIFLELAKYLEFKRLEFIEEKISNIQLETDDLSSYENFLVFVHDFCINATTTLKREPSMNAEDKRAGEFDLSIDQQMPLSKDQSTNANDEKTELLGSLPDEKDIELEDTNQAVERQKNFGISYFWKRMFIDHENCSQEKFFKSLDLFYKLLNKIRSFDLIKHYFRECLKYFKKNNLSDTSITLYIFITQKIIKIISMPNPKFFCEVIQAVEEAEKCRINSILIQNLFTERERFDDILKKGKSRKDYISHLRELFGLLKQLRSEPTHEELKALWENFYESPKCREERDLILDLFSQSEKSLESQTILFIFDELFCNYIEGKVKISNEQLSEKFISCFINYFKQSNKIHQILMHWNNKHFYYKQKMYDIHGWKTLWTIFLTNENTRIMDLIVETVVCLSPDLYVHKLVLWFNFINSCFQEIEKVKKLKGRRATRPFLLLINIFFDFVNQRSHDRIPQQIHDYNQPTVINRPSNDFLYLKFFLDPRKINEILMPKSENIKYLCMVISEIYSIPMSNFDLKIQQTVISDNGDLTLEKLDKKSIYLDIKQMANCYEESNHSMTDTPSELKRINIYYNEPKHLITDNPTNFDILFDIISLETSDEFNKQAWKLVQTLPLNFDRERKISNFLSHSQRFWEELLNDRNVYYLYYNLRILYKIFIGDPEFEESHIRNSVYRQDDEDDIEMSQEKEKIINQKLMNLKEKKKNFRESGGACQLVKVFNSLPQMKLFPELKQSIISNIIKILNQPHILVEDVISEFNSNQGESNYYFNALVKTIEFICCSDLDIDELSRRNLENNRNDDGVNLLKCCLNQIEKFFFKECFIRNGLFFEFSNNFILLFNILTNWEHKDITSELCNFLIKAFDKFNDGGIITCLFEKCFKYTFEINAKRECEDFPVVQLCISFIERFRDKIIMYTNIESVVKEILKYFENITNLSYHSNKYKDDSLALILLDYLKVIFLYIKLPYKENIMHTIFDICIFSLSPCIEIKRVICHNPERQRHALDLVMALVKISPLYLKDFLMITSDLFQRAKFKGNTKNSWERQVNVKDKSLTGYVGIKNLGCICYMNSLMQQLYMIPAWRKTILEIEDVKEINESPTILHEMKYLFTSLFLSQKKYVNPKKFCDVFKDEEGNSTNIHEQKDVFEFFNLFMDRLENEVKETAHKNFIKKIFGGSICNQLICKGCPHSSQKDEPFLALTIQVANKNNLYEGLKTFVEGEMLEGENAYYCEECKMKVNTLKRVCLKKLPNHLIFVLKRFEFDFNTYTKLKINDYYEFPDKIDMEPYTLQGFQKQQREENGGTEEDHKENEYPEQYFQYKLAGVIIHLGVADAGHYYSLIEDRYKNNDGSCSKDWLEFNDISVKNFEFKNMRTEAYGYQEKSYAQTRQSTSMSMKNAYLLFYDRVYFQEEKDDENTTMTQEVKPNVEIVKEIPREKIEEESPNTKEGSPAGKEEIFLEDNIPMNIRKQSELIWKRDMELDESRIPLEMKKEIKETNQIYFLNNIFFSNHFMRTYSHILRNPFSNSENEQNLNYLKQNIEFFLNVILRTKDKSVFDEKFKVVRSMLVENKELFEWLIEYMTHEDQFKELVLECPLEDKRAFICYLLNLALDNILEGFSNEFIVRNTELERDSIIFENFCKMFINSIPELKNYPESSANFFHILYKLTSHRQLHAIYYLLDNNIIGRLMVNFMECMEKNSVKDDPFKDGFNLVFKTSPILTNFGSYIDKRRPPGRKTFQNKFNHDYLWKSLRKLSYYCTISATVVNKEISASSPLVFKLKDIDQKILKEFFTSKNTINKMIETMKSLNGIYAASEFFIRVCFEIFNQDPQINLDLANNLKKAVSILQNPNSECTNFVIKILGDFLRKERNPEIWGVCWEKLKVSLMEIYKTRDSDRIVRVMKLVTELAYMKKSINLREISDTFRDWKDRVENNLRHSSQNNHSEIDISQALENIKEISKSVEEIFEAYRKNDVQAFSHENCKDKFKEDLIKNLKPTDIIKYHESHTYYNSDSYYKESYNARIIEIIDDYLKIEVEHKDINKQTQHKTLYLSRYSSNISYPDEEEESGSVGNEGSSSQSEPEVAF